MGVLWPRTRFKRFEKASYRFLPDFIANVAGAADCLQTSQPTAGKTNNNHAQKQEYRSCPQVGTEIRQPGPTRVPEQQSGAEDDTENTARSADE